MKIVKYITSLLEVKETKKVECAKVWMVSWNARYGSYHAEWKRVSKAFLNQDDAEAFKKTLIDAKNILQIKECLSIEVEEQKC